MMFKGNFYNSNRDGEGYSVHEYIDGKVIAYFYTYWMGKQMWLMGTGDRIGDSVTLEAIITEGHHIGNPGKVKEFPWGTISLTDNGDETIDMTYQSNDGSTSGGYTLYPLYKPKENNNILLEKWHVNKWIPINDFPPISSTVQFYRSNAKTRTLIWKYRVTVKSGTLTNLKVSNSGPYNPEIKILVDNVESDKRNFSKNDKFDIHCYFGPVVPVGEREWAGFIIKSNEHGTFFNVWAMLLGR